MREDEADERSSGERRQMRRKMQGAMEREACEGRLGSRPGGAARQSGQDGTHHGALRDRSETFREVNRLRYSYMIFFLFI